jgi:hypothetical protein
LFITVFTTGGSREEVIIYRDPDFGIWKKAESGFIMAGFSESTALVVLPLINDTLNTRVLSI